MSIKTVRGNLVSCEFINFNRTSGYCDRGRKGKLILLKIKNDVTAKLNRSLVSNTPQNILTKFLTPFLIT